MPARRFLIAIVAAAVAGPAAAQSCSFTVTNLAFGNVDVTANTTVNSTATLSASCSGTARQTVRICPNIGSGSAGSGANGSPRRMISSGNTLDFNIFKDSSRTQVWGSYLHGFASATPPQIDLSLGNQGSRSTSATLYGQVFAGQSSAAVGSYATAFTGSDVRIRYGYASAGTCATMSSALEGTASFSASAPVIPRCTVGATALDFGATGNLSSAIDAANVISVSCTRGAPFQVGLDGGSTNATDPTRRAMRNGSRRITYGLYRDPARTLPWGSTLNANTASATGTGLTQNLVVYGRVPSQTTPAQGLYTDTVVVTVTY